MRKLLLAVLLLVFAVDAADARKRRHHRYHPHFVVVTPEARGALDRRLQADPRAIRAMPRSARRAALTMAEVIPRGWQLQPPDPNWNGKRYISPDGAAWFAAYATAANARPVSEHMKAIAFAEGETVTYLRGERTWLAVSGFKESRIFYRKALLACAGRTWHHIAFEYPAELKARMDPLVMIAAQVLDASQADCGEAVSADRPRP